MQWFFVFTYLGRHNSCPNPGFELDSRADRCCIVHCCRDSIITRIISCPIRRFPILRCLGNTFGCGSCHVWFAVGACSLRYQFHHFVDRKSGSVDNGSSLQPCCSNRHVPWNHCRSQTFFWAKLLQFCSNNCNRNSDGHSSENSRAFGFQLDFLAFVAAARIRRKCDTFPWSNSNLQHHHHFVHCPDCFRHSSCSQDKVQISNCVSIEPERSKQEVSLFKACLQNDTTWLVTL
jgi:hypothetical protein